MALPSSAWSRVPMCRQADPFTGLETGCLARSTAPLWTLYCMQHGAPAFKLQADEKQVCTATWMLSWPYPSYAGPSAASLPLHLWDLAAGSSCTLHVWH